MQFTVISTDNIKAFAARYAEKLQQDQVKAKINQLVTDWKDNEDFSYQEAKTAAKEILGKKTRDEDVIFMLRLFCITNPDSANFEANFEDLMKYLD